MANISLNQRQRSATALREGAGNGEEHHIMVPGPTPSTHTSPPAASIWTGWSGVHIVADLFVVVSLLIIFAALEKVSPRAGYMIFDTMYKHSYPYKANSVPSWSVPLYSIGAPFVAFLVWKFVEYRRKVSWYDWYRVFIALLFAVFLTGAITNAIKVAIGRPRPNFFFQCWPDGKDVYKDATRFGGYPLCVDPDHVEEYRKSFPSGVCLWCGVMMTTAGHSSWSASGLGFMTYFLLGQTRTFVLGKARAWAMVVSLIPALSALIVGVSRITDYWHNVSDVCVGLALGYIIAMISYLMMFPFFTHEQCYCPRHALAEPKAREAGSLSGA